MPTRKPLVEIDRKIREQRQQIEGQSLFEGFVRPDEINKLNDDKIQQKVINKNKKIALFMKGTEIVLCYCIFNNNMTEVLQFIRSPKISTWK